MMLMNSKNGDVYRINSRKDLNRADRQFVIRVGQYYVGAGEEDLEYTLVDSLRDALKLCYSAAFILSFEFCNGRIEEYV